jgi:hypothetical protein
LEGLKKNEKPTAKGKHKKKESAEKKKQHPRGFHACAEQFPADLHMDCLIE